MLGGRDVVYFSHVYQVAGIHLEIYKLDPGQLAEGQERPTATHGLIRFSQDVEERIVTVCLERHKVKLQEARCVAPLAIADNKKEGVLRGRGCISMLNRVLNVQI